MDLKILFEALQTGGPLGMAAVFCWMWWLERRDRKANQEQLFELSATSIESVTKMEGALVTLTKLIETSRRRD